jgi:hypothetical protein
VTYGVWGLTTPDHQKGRAEHEGAILARLQGSDVETGSASRPRPVVGHGNNHKGPLTAGLKPRPSKIVVRNAR